MLRFEGFLHRTVGSFQILMLPLRQLVDGRGACSRGRNSSSEFSINIIVTIIIIIMRKKKKIIMMMRRISENRQMLGALDDALQQCDVERES